ncbi:MAG: hypothetical protein H6Q28_325 [Bacteroidetes bacterium]|nr:hypothetical protein [Bacteroidota bacterium]
MRHLLLLAFLLLLPGIATAGILGGIVSLGVGASFNSPAGDFADHAAAGWGGMAGVKIGVPIIDITGAVEYMSFGEKDFTGGSAEASMWGFTAGGRFTLFPFLYAGVEVGSFAVTQSTTIGSQETEGKITYGAYGPTVGLNFASFDFNARYMVMESASFTSLRLIYWF